jgi:hypothetical protein
MLFLQPIDHLFAQFAGEGGEFFRFFGADLAGGVIFGCVSFRAAGVEVVGVVLSI